MQIIVQTTKISRITTEKPSDSEIKESYRQTRKFLQEQGKLLHIGEGAAGSLEPTETFDYNQCLVETSYYPTANSPVHEIVIAGDPEKVEETDTSIGMSCCNGYRENSVANYQARNGTDLHSFKSISDLEKELTQ